MPTHVNRNRQIFKELFLKLIALMCQLRKIRKPDDIIHQILREYNV